ncbi:AcvB/VirJ family lysyl-phosphatidylglycerol hydrolase [uncultured Sphingobacterium sp.]|uniref:AcvB/VirJ family lysyl-phosphatidylglycerol hydrolase n=1 Tax=uncultured Sphingobacterium sp. TaxID=182688 RepID=UPI0025ECDA50|nr:AcvB/VirJ family lysyl-phosphatidylglycerol hydrolase [uncultured Sphingobacterium sp.]
MLLNIKFLLAIMLFSFVSPQLVYAQIPNYVIPEIKGNTIEKTLVVFITGDGGYNNFSKSLLRYFEREGFDRLILDSKKYFWKKKTPKEASQDFERYIHLYLEKSKCDNIYIIGHSFSAAILPFIIHHFSAALQKKIRHATFLSPDRYASLEVTLSTMLNFKQKANEYEVLPEAIKLKSISSTYVFCKEGEEDLASLFQKAGLPVTRLEGPHNYNRNFEAIYQAIKLRK